MSIEENKNAVMRMFEEVMNQGKFQAVDELVADDYKLTDPPGFPPGKEGLRALANMYRTGAPDLHMTVEDVIGEGDHVAVRWTATGTQTGEMMGMPPTGQKLQFRAVSWLRMKGGRIAEEWTQFTAT